MSDKLEIVVKYNKFDVHESTNAEIIRPHEERIPIPITRPYRYHKVHEDTIEDKTTHLPIKVIVGKTYSAGKSEVKTIESPLYDACKIQDLVCTCSVEFYREDASDSGADFRAREFIERARIALKDKPIHVELKTHHNSKVDSEYNNNPYNKYIIFRVKENKQ